MGNKKQTGNKLCKTQDDLVEEMLKADQKGKSQKSVAKALNRSESSVSQSLIIPKVEQALAQRKEEVRKEKVKIGRVSKRGAERSTRAIEILMDKIAKKLEDGEDVTQDEQDKLFQLQVVLFKTYSKSKELGIDADEEETVTPAEALEIANETIDLLHYYLTIDPQDRNNIDIQVRTQIVDTGAVDISSLDPKLAKAGDLASIIIDVVLDKEGE